VLAEQLVRSQLGQDDAPESFLNVDHVLIHPSRTAPRLILESGSRLSRLDSAFGKGLANQDGDVSPCRAL